MDHGAMVDQAAANVLAHSEILMASPSSSKLNSFYPNPSESECTIAQAVCNSGQLFIQSNAKSLPGSSDFMVSTPNIMDCPQLLMSLTIPAIPAAVDGSDLIDQRQRVYFGTYHDGWGFDLIEQLEVSFANSNISNLQIKGHAMRDWSLLQCKNADERQQMLRIAGRGQTWTREKERVITACVPLSFLFFRSAGGVKGGFGIDGRVLNGPISFQFTFKPLNYAVAPVASLYERYKFGPPYELTQPNNDGGNIASSYPSYPASLLAAGQLPTSFTQLELTMRTYQLMDGTFSVSKALEANPSLIYSIPSLWMNTYSYNTEVSAQGFIDLNINSVPAGMIQAIIVRVRPVNSAKYLPPTALPVDPPGFDTDANRQGEFQYRLNYEPSGPDYRSPMTNGEAGKSGVTASYRPYVPWSLPIRELQLQYSGQSIYNAKTGQSHDGFTRSIFNDDLKTLIAGLPLTQNVVGQIPINDYANVGAAATNFSCPITGLANLGDDAMVDHETQVVVIPFMHDGDSIFRHRSFENLPHYSGSTLQLRIGVEPYNYYYTNGYSRIQCNPRDGTQFTRPADRSEMSDYIDQFQSNGGNRLTYQWTSESSSSGRTAYPSNNLQHVALCRAPRQAVIKYAAVDFVETVNRERVLFNSGVGTVNDQYGGNQQRTGAMAYTSAGGLVTVDLTYVVASLFQVTNGVAELQL